MPRMKHRGGGRWSPAEPTPGMRVDMAARAITEERIRQQLRERREEARAQAEAERLGLGTPGPGPETEGRACGSG